VGLHVSGVISPASVAELSDNYINWLYIPASAGSVVTSTFSIADRPATGTSRSRRVSIDSPATVSVNQIGIAAFQEVFYFLNRRNRPLNVGAVKASVHGAGCDTSAVVDFPVENAAVRRTDSSSYGEMPQVEATASGRRRQCPCARASPGVLPPISAVRLAIMGVMEGVLVMYAFLRRDHAGSIHVNPPDRQPASTRRGRFSDA
jgi:hypothetical protein